MSEEFENMEESAEENNGVPETGDQSTVMPLSGMYKEWFLDYASYVILERAVPALLDGFKPVQRRILHSMFEMEDGRYNKVANIIGNTMKFHPHGDASIGDALVQIGQKELLIDMQGNWGNTFTGDRAAASRYIEARLTKFALEVVFNKKTTNWLSSYDGRNQEPEFLPVKFPLLLAQGAEGIAVGMACKIMPHNFIELIDASIDILRDKNPKIFPDFYTGGQADFTQYNDGLRGGKIRVRARIRQEDKRTLVIHEIPIGTTTTSAIESARRANNKAKIKIRKIEDNTAEYVEILIHLPAGISPDKTIDALFAFTDCEVSISPNTAVIIDDKPQFMGVTEVLKFSTQKTFDLLKLELQIKKGELEEQWHFSSLEKIFIEKRIYRDIEEEETWDGVIAAIDKGLKPHIKHLKRKVTRDDVIRLTEIKIKRISKFNAYKADEILEKLEDELAKVIEHLNNMVDFTINYFKHLKEKYSKDRERKTEIRIFDTIQAKKVIVANKKLYTNQKEGFIGWSLKKDEFIADCSEIDDVIVFRSDGVMIVTKVADKKFVGKNLLHVGLWKKGDTRTIYHMIYRDGAKGAYMMKRFAVKSVTRDKEYKMTKGNPGSSVIYLSVHPNGEREVVTVQLRARAKLKKLRFDIDFSELMIKGRSSMGNRVTKETVNRVIQKEVGISTLAARKIWFDDVVGRLNDEQRGNLIGEFIGGDKILTLYKSGQYRISNFDLSTRFDEGLVKIEKWNSDHTITAVYYEPTKKLHYVKRFAYEITTDKMVSFLPDKEGAYLDIVTTDYNPLIKLVYSKRYKETKFLKDKIIELREFIDLKGMKGLGNQLTKLPIKEIILLKPKDSETWDLIDPKDEADSIEEDDHIIEDIAIDNIEEQIVSNIKKEESESIEKTAKDQPKETKKRQPKKVEKKPVKKPKKEPAKPKDKKKVKLEPEKAIEVELVPIAIGIENTEVVELDSSEKTVSIDLDVEAKPKKKEKPKSKPKSGKASKKVIKPNEDDEEDQMTLF